MAIMTFDEFITYQFKNKSRMGYKVGRTNDAYPSPSVIDSLDAEMDKLKTLNRYSYYDEIDFSKPFSDVKSYIRKNHSNIFINFFDFPKVIVNPKVYDWYLKVRAEEEAITFKRFLEILTDEDEPMHYEYIAGLNEVAGIPTKSVGGGPTSSDFYEYIDQQLEKGVSIEDLDVLDLVTPTVHILARIGFKISILEQDAYSGLYWSENKTNVSWTDNHNWSLYHTQWWFPPNIFVLNVDEVKTYSFINWLAANPLEVKQ